MLDMIFPTELYRASFSLHESMTSGKIVLRVGNDNVHPQNNSIMDTISITSEQSKDPYDSHKLGWKHPVGRYFSIHLVPEGINATASLYVCKISVLRDRYCPKEWWETP